MKKANIINGNITVFNNGLPNTFNQCIGGYANLDASIHYADGFRNFVDVEPTETQKKGGLIFDAENDIYTYELIDLTQVEIDVNLEVKINTYKESVNTYFSMMYTRALSSSMNKRSSDLNYLLGLREEYTDKYGVSKGLIMQSDVRHQSIQDAILGEMEDEFTEAYLDAILPLYGLPVEGTHQDKMYALIVFKYEYGLNAFNIFNKFIRRFRTKCNKWIDSVEFNKLDNAFSIVDNLPDSLSLADAELLYNQFNSL